MKKVLSNLFDVICFGLGPMLIAYSPFGTQPRPYWQGEGGKVPDFNETALIIGIALICFGLLRKYWAKKG